LEPTSTWRSDEGAPPLAPGAIVLCAFPSAGLAATVAAHYILRSLALPRIGTFDTPGGLPVAIVQNGQVNPPIRVYGRSDLALILSEFPAVPSTVRPIAEAVLDGAERMRARLVLTLEGVVPHPIIEEGEVPEESVWSVMSKPNRELAGQLERSKAAALTDGVIGGVTGAMLVLGQNRSIPVATLLVSARATDGYPDHRAGAALIEALDRFLPDLKIDTAPLRTQAEIIERALRQAMKGRGKMAEIGGGPTGAPGPASQPPDSPIYG
jgi:predicted ATP-grasp superfamily ATP-dependent carboligase